MNVKILVLVAFVLFIGVVSASTTTTYPVKTINETRILPNVDTYLPPVGLNISINATPGQFEASSFVIKPDVAVTDYTITATDLTSGANTIYKNATTIRLVKAWYQADDDIEPWDSWSNFTISYNLVPELLLNNDSLIRVNYTTRQNEIWIKNATFEGYYHIDNTTSVFPTDIQIYDNPTAQGFPIPFALPTNENKQVWLTTHVPAGQAAGNYTGQVWINSSTTTPIAMNFSVRVLNFTFPTHSLEYSLYYESFLVPATTGISNHWTPYRNVSMITAELQNIKDHGIEYPIMYVASANRDDTIELLNLSGLPQDQIHLFWTDFWFDTNTTADINDLGEFTRDTKTAATSYGFGTNYIYGRDEANLASMLTEIPLLSTIQTNGSKTMAATAPVYNAYTVLGSLLDIAVMGSDMGDPGFNSTERARWQALGKKIWVYGNPQAGIENPELYRSGYGYELVQSGYDGEALWAYYAIMGNSGWNDYDYNTYHRDEMMVYPKSDGVIDTIQWEGFREGIVDTWYADTLTYVNGTNTSALAIINAGIAAGSDMSVIRNTLIDQIIVEGGGEEPPAGDPPVAAFTKSKVIIRIPSSLTVNDTSTNTPTGWNWSFGDGGTNTTTNSVVKKYTRPGIFTIGLTASNGNGSSYTSSRVWVIGGGHEMIPYTTHYDSCEDATYSTSRELSPAERFMIDERMMGVCEGI